MEAVELAGRVRVEVEWIGEGECGDYDERDEHDVPLVRFRAVDLSRAGRDAQDASYCTRVPAYAPAGTLRELAEQIARSLAPLPHWKRAAEAWSWASVDARGRLVPPTALLAGGIA